MSIEVNDESGEDVDAERARRAGPVRARPAAGPPAGRAVGARGRRRRPWRRCTSSGWTSRARPTCCRSRWTSCARAPTTDDPEPGLLGDVVLCPAVAAQQAAAAGHSHGRGARPALHARHPAPARLRPRRARRGARDVRPAARAARATGDERAARDARRDTATWLLVLAGLLVVVGGLFAGAEAALSRVSRVAAEELERQGRRGAARLQQVARRPGPLSQPATLLRVAAELVATVLVTVASLDRFDRPGRRCSSPASRWWSCPTSRWASRRARSAVSTRPGRARQRPVRAPAGPRPRSAAQLLILVGNALTPGKGFRDGPFASEAELRDLVDLARGEQADRGPRAGDDPLGLRAGRHDRPRGHGAAHRRRLHRAAQDAAPGAVPRPAQRFQPHPRRRRGHRRRRRRGLPQGPGPAHLRVPRRRVGRAGRVGHAPGHLRAGEQAGRRAAARDAGAADPHGDRGRRVRRHRRAGHHRGRPGGDRRRDHRRVRRGGTARRASCPTARSGSAPGCTSTSWPSASTSSSRTTTSTPSAACSPSTSAGCRSPARTVSLHGIELTAESAQGRRNRIGTVLVRRAAAPRPDEPSRPSGGGAPMSATPDALPSRPRTPSW